MTRYPHLILVVAIGSIGSIGDVAAADLHPNTISAFDRYVRLTEARMDTELRGEAPFLWIDRVSESQRAEADARLRRGEIVVSALETRDGGKDVNIPGGLRHHWVGTVFIAGIPIEQAVALMQDYDRYDTVYSPNVRRSKLLAREGEHFSVYLQLFVKKVVSVVLNTEYDIRYVPVAPNRMHVRSYANRIAEVENPGTPQEHEKPVGNDNGFLWRFNNYCGLELRNGGTYMQCETVSLSRDVPFGLGWFIRPFITGIPKESLEFTLNAMRTALTKGRRAVDKRRADPTTEIADVSADDNLDFRGTGAGWFRTSERLPRVNRVARVIDLAHAASANERTFQKAASDTACGSHRYLGGATGT